MRNLNGNIPTVVVLVVVLLVPSGTCAARVITVDDDGPAEFSNIQTAINAASYGSRIVVQPGTYNERINFNGKNITVTSTDPGDWNVVTDTIIEADSPGSVATFTSGEGLAAILTGFTITGGTGTEGSNGTYGGGIYCRQASPTVQRNIVTGNSADYGGGICCRDTQAVVEENIVTDNSAFMGGGIEIYHWVFGPTYYGDATIRNNVIYDNLANFAGGVSIYNGYLINNTIVDNHATYDGGNVSAYKTTQKGELRLINNIICYGTAGWCGGGLCWQDDEYIYFDEISYNNVYGNSGNYCYVPSQTGLNGNISANPRFVNRAGRDYHLLGESPCIDTGNPSMAFDLEREPDGGRINMGAYGNTPEAACKGGLVLESYNLVSRTRVDRTTFDYVYTMTLNNNSKNDVVNAMVELLEASDNISIMDGTVSFASIGAGQSVESDDTFALQIDRSIPIDATVISWRASYQLAGGGNGQKTFTTRLDFVGDLPGDLAADGVIDVEDLARLTDVWLWQGQPGEIAEDIAADGRVDFIDLAVLAEDWE